MGTKLKLGFDDLVMASKMTEKEFVEYAGPKSYPSYFKVKEDKEETETKEVERTEQIDNTITEITNIGKVLVNICQKLDLIIDLEKTQTERLDKIAERFNFESDNLKKE